MAQLIMLLILSDIAQLQKNKKVAVVEQWHF